MVLYGCYVCSLSIPGLLLVILFSSWYSLFSIVCSLICLLSITLVLFGMTSLSDGCLSFLDPRGTAFSRMAVFGTEAS